MIEEKIEPYPCDGCLKQGHLCYGCYEIEQWESKYLFDSKGLQKCSLAEIVEKARKNKYRA